MTTRALTASATMRAPLDEVVDNLTDQDWLANSTASSPLVKLTAQWATSTSSNILKVQTATIDEVA
ncbi:MAG: hypothetical protein JWR32_1605 [Mycobacterium sp.]|jgi:hypothetical protein|nr:hypothetical protein [Mycobacterium sp.]MDT5229720.1 hypothetical protein [Mycobacterium sp.]